MKIPTFQQWQQLWQAAGCRGDSRPDYDRLAQAYAEPQRHYHNFQHIAECLEAFDLVRHLARQPLAVEMAIWFHDAVYDPPAPDNEEQSAALTVRCLTEAGAGPDLAATVRRLVLATKLHETGNDLDVDLLVDVDLGILGKSQARFEEYEAQIRREYSWVPVKIYAAKRAEILRHFLARERIYVTDPFHDRWERAARANLQRSIQNLEATGS